jgi:hypothetical protein
MTTGKTNRASITEQVGEMTENISNFNNQASEACHMTAALTV